MGTEDAGATPATGFECPHPHVTPSEAEACARADLDRGLIVILPGEVLVD